MNLIINAIVMTSKKVAEYQSLMNEFQHEHNEESLQKVEFIQPQPRKMV
jgi:hypothetical protein